MLNLDSLLGRFRKSLGRNVLAKEAIVETIEFTTGIKLKDEEVDIKEFVLEISTSPIKKNEIKLHEEEILSLVRTRTNQNIRKIFYK